MKSTSTDATAKGYGSSGNSSIHSSGNVAFDFAMMSLNPLPCSKGFSPTSIKNKAAGGYNNPKRGKTVEITNRSILKKFKWENKGKAHDEFIESFFLNPNNVVFRR